MIGILTGKFLAFFPLGAIVICELRRKVGFGPALMLPFPRHNAFCRVPLVQQTFEHALLSRFGLLAFDHLSGAPLVNSTGMLRKTNAYATAALRYQGNDRKLVVPWTPKVRELFGSLESGLQWNS